MRQVTNGKLTMKVEIVRFQDKNFLDIRNYYTDALGTLKPTQKGIMFNPEIGEELAQAILETLDDYSNGKKAPSQISNSKDVIPEGKFPIYFVCIGAPKEGTTLPKDHCYRSIDAAKSAPRDFSGSTAVYIVKATHYRVDGKKVTIGGKLRKLAKWNGKAWVKPPVKPAA